MDKVKAKCAECKRRFEKLVSSRRLCCSEECRIKRQQRQLQELNERRRKGKPEDVKCAACGKEFTPYASQRKQELSAHAHYEVFCQNPACKAERKRRAIERINLRREQAKKQREMKVKQEQEMSNAN